jgi:hypothetical protein
MPSPSPVLIDGAQAAGVYQDRDFTGGNHLYRNYEPVSYGGALWAFPLTNTGYYSAWPVYVTVYKSIDAGLSWDQQDAANAPIWDVSAIVPFVANFYWDGVSSTVTIVYVKALSSVDHSCTVYLVDFDMATGLYGVPYGINSIGPNSISYSVAQPCLFKLSSGALRLVYQFNAQVLALGILNDEQVVYYQDFIAGAWGTAVPFPNQTVAMGNNGQLWSAFQDGDLIHCVYSVGTVTGVSIGFPVVNQDYVYRYVAILANGTFSATVALNSFLFNLPTVSGFVTTGAVSGAKIFIPICEEFGSPSNETCGVLEASPSGAPATAFSYTQIGIPNQLTDFRVLHQPGQDSFVWNDVNPVTNNSSLFHSSTNSGGGWSAPALLLSLDATPPPPVTGQDTLDVISLSLGTNLNGSLGLIFTSWAGYSFLGGAAPAPLAVECDNPPQAAVGAPVERLGTAGRSRWGICLPACS